MAVKTKRERERVLPHLLLLSPVRHVVYDGNGGENWTYKTCKAPVKSSPPTDQHPIFYRPDALPVAQPKVSEH